MMRGDRLERHSNILQIYVQKYIFWVYSLLFFVLFACEISCVLGKHKLGAAAK